MKFLQDFVLSWGTATNSTPGSSDAYQRSNCQNISGIH